MYEVHVHDEQDHLPLDGAFLRAVVERTLQTEGIAAADISIAVLDDAAVHAVNRDYLQHDCPTDVITFPLNDPPFAGFAGENRPLEGEIVISAETACRRAADFDWSPHDELVLYLVHGLLHLAGYDDHSPDDRKAMRKREQTVLALWGLHPRYDETGEPADDSSLPGGSP